MQSALKGTGHTENPGDSVFWHWKRLPFIGFFVVVAIDRLPTAVGLCPNPTARILHRTWESGLRPHWRCIATALLPDSSASSI